MFDSIRRYYKRLQAAEISMLTRYADAVVQCAPHTHDDGTLREFLQGPAVRTATLEEFVDSYTADEKKIVILNGNLNHSDNIQQLLEGVRSGANRQCRVVVVAYNPYLSFLYRLFNFLGIRQAPMPRTFVRWVELQAIVKLAGFEIVRSRYVGYLPRLLGLGHLVNKLLPLVPGLRLLSLSNIIVLRPVIKESTLPSLSIVIPARNEEGNIENAVKRLPRIEGVSMELIFVEGHSTDKTWQEIKRILPLYQDRFAVKAFQQSGKGKNDAVRVGFAQATGDLLLILDADLTVPPELVDQFYFAYVNGHADFVNGNRLVYQPDTDAIQPLNLLGNVFFAKALSWTLDHRLGDTLCGTKLVHRQDYRWMTAWRQDFGDFDPFGDFDLLFPMAVMGIGSIDLPVHYRARQYGATNISRFRHGLELLKMTLIGFFKIKLGLSSKPTATTRNDGPQR